KAEPARFDPDRYTERGKWMDGWETRRRRSPGYDWVIIELGRPGVVRAVDVDTHHFLGNHPAEASLDGLFLDGAGGERDGGESALTDCEWRQLIPRFPLQRGSHNLVLAAQDLGELTHVRLKIYPDGGVARLRIWGQPRLHAEDGQVELACSASGGRAVACSDMFFGRLEHLIAPGEPANMGGGWETRRRRGAGHDWAVIQLAAPAVIERLEIDTRHFKGNFPDRCSVDVCTAGALSAVDCDAADWRPLVPPTAMGPDARHTFDAFDDTSPVDHVRLNVFPDGGVARLRVWGRPVSLRVDLQALDDDELHHRLKACCGSERWVDAMVEAVRGGSGSNRTDLFRAAESAADSLDRKDWLEAFSHHPRIGDVEALRERFGARSGAWSESEQSGVSGAADAVIERLADGNRRYEERFGYLFIVCATGKSAGEMLELLETRLGNSPERELTIAAHEQRKITRLRLAKWLDA
ncbi:MAG: allantoicase, partial [Acidobacteriota bacterium]